MSRSRRKPRVSRPAQPRAGVRPKGSSTYVAVVHGIGETGAEAWAAKSVAQLTDWWVATDFSPRAAMVPCQPDCRLGDSLGHRHLEVSDQKRSHRVDLEPIYWAEAAERPSRLRTAVITLEATLLIGIVDLM